MLAVSKIGRITTAGVITEFPVPTAGSSPRGITAGPDGNLWFTEWLSGKIGRITPAGVISEFTTPTASNTHGITTGPDGNLWFTETTGDNIGRITTAGAITEFPVNGHPSGITAGPDGNLWFAEFLGGGGKIGRITTAGTVTEFPVPTASDLEEITAGPDGNLWFTGYGAIGRITTAGIVTEFSVSGSYLQGITAGPDGNLWFGGGLGAGRITTAGTVTEFPGAGGPGITTGPDGNLWFAGGEEIGRIMPEQTTLTPGSGPANVETALAAAGFGFAGGATVKIGGLAATNVSVLHPTRLTLASPVLTAGTLNDLKIVEPDGSLSVRLKAWLVDFVDVPASDGFHDYIATIFRDGITAGYGNGYYGRDDRITRAQMAVFLLTASRARITCRPPATLPCRSSRTCPVRRICRELHRRPLSSRHNGRISRRHLRPQRPHESRPDGRRAADHAARGRIRAANLRPREPRLRGRRVPCRLRRELHRRALPRRDHRRVRYGAAEILPREPEHSRSDGGVPGQNIWPALKQRRNQNST